MAQQYYRDPNNTNVLLNKSNSHTSRLAVKRNFLKQKTEISDLKTQLDAEISDLKTQLDAEISDLKTQLDELRAIVEGLTGE
jgi:hypothetical protein